MNKLRLYRATAVHRNGKNIGEVDTFHVAGQDEDEARTTAQEAAPEGYKVLHLDCKGKVYVGDLK